MVAKSGIILSMNRTHRKTLAAVFTDPISGDIEWRRIEVLFKAAGSDMIEGGGSRSDTSRFSFQYDPSYLEDPDAISLSLSLPMREAPYLNDTARSFFNNLLPEGEVRSLIAKIKQISEQNDFKLLESIGGECAGAVSIIQEQTVLSTESDYTVLPEQELEDIITEHTMRPALILKDESRLSLAGA